MKTSIRVSLRKTRAPKATYTHRCCKRQPEVGFRRSHKLGDGESAHWTRRAQEREKEGCIEEGGKWRAPASKYITLKLAWERRIFILNHVGAE